MGTPSLAGCHPAGVEGAPVAGDLHGVFDVDADPATLDEVGVQRLRQPVARNGGRGSQGLCGDQAASDNRARRPVPSRFGTWSSAVECHQTGDPTRRHGAVQ